MKKIAFLFSLLSILSACGGGSSSSGANNATSGGTSTNRTNFDGVYTGTLNLTASALGVSQTESDDITITISGNSLMFQGDEPNETFTVTVNEQGSFSGNLSIDQDGCSGSVQLRGQVNGQTATGSVSGSGVCVIDGSNIDVELSGDFSASK